MDAEHLINVMKEVIACYEIVHLKNDFGKEIEYWRTKFLMTASLEEKGTLGSEWQIISNTFLFMPCDTFMKQSPEKHLEDIKKYIKS